MMVKPALKRAFLLLVAPPLCVERKGELIKGSGARAFIFNCIIVIGIICRLDSAELPELQCRYYGA